MACTRPPWTAAGRIGVDDRAIDEQQRGANREQLSLCMIDVPENVNNLVVLHALRNAPRRLHDLQMTIEALGWNSHCCSQLLTCLALSGPA